MAIENANSHPYKVAITKESGEMYANSHPYQVVIVGGGGGQEGRVVDELPEVGEPGYIYLVLKEESSEGNIYDEYMWVLQRDGETYGWEHIATTDEVRVPTVVQTTGTSTEDVMSQKAVTDALASASPTVVQTTGTSTTDVMSQKAVTDALASAGPTVVQTTGTSTTDVMSQDAVSRMVYVDPSSKFSVFIGSTAPGSYSGSFSTRIGGTASAGAEASTAIGFGAVANLGVGSIALGARAKATQQGEMNIGSTSTAYGYSNSKYRLLTGLYDPQSDHDAATKGYVDTAVASAGAEEFTTAEWNSLWT